tara:strand:+ start:689 stop:790 length:102 start_codon:yes stop_codon:yes gene_type:complete
MRDENIRNKSKKNDVRPPEIYTEIKYNEKKIIK